MAIQYMDNFSIYGASEAALIAGTPWSTVSNSDLVDDVDGVSSGKVLKVENSVSTQPSLVLPTATDVFHIGFRWWCSALPISQSEGHDFEVRDTNNDIRYIWHVLPTGAIVLTRTDGAGNRVDNADVSGFTDLATSGNVLDSGVWNHVEFFLNRTTGEYSVKVEGITIMSGTDGSPATGDTGIVSWRDAWYSSASANQSVYIKDLVIADDAGSFNNSGIGTVRVVTLLPDGDVSSGWTTSSGTTDWDLLNETTPDDAGFISAEDDPLPDASIMTLTDLPPDVVGVRALQTMVRGFKSDGGDANLVVSLLSDGSEDTGSTQVPATSASYLWDVSETDPATATLWNPVAVDAATIKIDRTA